MDNKNFIKESQTKDTGITVIPPPISQPFTTQLIREGLTKIATGQMDHADLAEELNKVAHNFYSKK